MYFFFVWELGAGVPCQNIILPGLNARLLATSSETQSLSKAWARSHLIPDWNFCSFQARIAKSCQLRPVPVTVFHLLCFSLVLYAYLCNFGSKKLTKFSKTRVFLQDKTAFSTGTVSTESLWFVRTTHLFHCLYTCVTWEPKYEYCITVVLKFPKCKQEQQIKGIHESKAIDSEAICVVSTTSGQCHLHIT